VAFTVRDMTALFEMVRQGLGVTIVPSLSPPAERHDLRIVDLKPAHRRSLLAVTRSHQPAPTPAPGSFHKPVMYYLYNRRADTLRAAKADPFLDGREIIVAVLATLILRA